MFQCHHPVTFHSTTIPTVTMVSPIEIKKLALSMKAIIMQVLYLVLLV